MCETLAEKRDAPHWDSEAVRYDVSRRLVYARDEQGNRIPDFSYAGYHNGNATVPDVAVATEIQPDAGDNTARIQQALDEVATLPFDERGQRGAVLLAPGRYEIRGSLFLRESGVVLRGSGDGQDPERHTLLVFVGDSPHQRDGIIVGRGVIAPHQTGTPIELAEDALVGSSELILTEEPEYEAGVEVVIHRPSTAEWIAANDNGGVVADSAWVAGELDAFYVRRVVAVDGTVIRLNVPVFDHLRPQYGPVTVAPLAQRTLATELGIESLAIEIETAGGQDEAHAWNAILVQGAEDVWIRDLTISHFGKAGVATRVASRVTVSNVRALDPIAQRIGERMYNFDVERGSELILFTGCEATGARHGYIVNGASEASGIVFHRSRTAGAADDTETHRRLSQGVLFDNVENEDGGEIRLINRGDFGTGHGWTAAHSVIWNSIGQLSVQKPPTAQNYLVSGKGSLDTDYDFPGPTGHTEHRTDLELFPESLYEAQLCDRQE